MPYAFLLMLQIILSCSELAFWIVKTYSHEVYVTSAVSPSLPRAFGRSGAWMAVFCRRS